jgi:hypothetical protein
MRSPFVIHEEGAGTGVFRVYVFGRVGLFPSGSREDAERMIASLEYERAQWNKTVNAELDDLRALLARAVEIFGAEVNDPGSPDGSVAPTSCDARRQGEVMSCEHWKQCGDCHSPGLVTGLRTIENELRARAEAAEAEAAEWRARYAQWTDADALVLREMVARREAEAEVDRLIAEIHAWRHVAAYYLGDMADHASPQECRAEAVRRSTSPTPVACDYGHPRDDGHRPCTGPVALRDCSYERELADECATVKQCHCCDSCARECYQNV